MESDELERSLRGARQGVHPRWTEERGRILMAGVRRDLRRRRLVQASALAVVLIAAISVLTLRLIGTPQPGPGRTALPEDIVFKDGSLAHPLDGDTVLGVPEDSKPGRMLVPLKRGKVRFEVAKNKDRTFEVMAGDVKVTVIGTTFTVSRSADLVGVSVESGRVRVDAAGRTVVLNPRESATFKSTDSEQTPRQPDATAAPVTAPDSTVTADTPQAQSGVNVATAFRQTRKPDRPEHPETMLGEPAKPPAPDSGNSWRALADSGKYGEAYAMISSMKASEIPGEMDKLLLAADVSRLAAHPDTAIRLLTKALQEHPGDPREQMAAFALGKALLEDAGRPGDAAKAFRRAYDADPVGPLAEDARAREVEARYIQGDRKLARLLAEEYIRLYPSGARLSAVKHFGGIE